MKSFEDLRKSKVKSDDRIIVLRPMDGKPTLDGKGLLDPGLFTGGNQLHALKHPLYATWYLKYEKGGIPNQLKQQFTSFNKLVEIVNRYYNVRNVEIKEIIE